MKTMLSGLRIALSNLNKDMVKENPDYVVRKQAVILTAKASWIISSLFLLPILFIATTSKLLSTVLTAK
jgi:hypothetical protein